MFRRTTLLICVGLIVGCQAGPAPLTEADREAIRSEIEGRNRALLDLVGNSSDAETMRPFYVSDPSRYFVGEPAVFAQSIRLLSTPDDVVEFFRPMAANRQGTPMEVQNSHVAVLSRDIALHVTFNHWAIIDNEGVRGETFPAAITNLWVRDGDEWKMLHTHQSWSNEPVTGG
jgi:hypothetical protein